MNTQDTLLRLKVSEPILELVRQALEGELEDVPNGDLQSITEALAGNIIQLVRKV